MDAGSLPVRLAIKDVLLLCALQHTIGNTAMKVFKGNWYGYVEARAFEGLVLRT